MPFLANLPNPLRYARLVGVLLKEYITEARIVDISFFSRSHMFGLDARVAEMVPTHDRLHRPLNVISHPVYTSEENRSVKVNSELHASPE